HIQKYENKFASYEIVIYLWFMGKIHYSDELERYIGESLIKNKILFEKEKLGLDFYLTDYDVFIEVKKFHTDRVNNQLQRYDNIILIQGRKSVDTFIKLLLK